ncbi:hypothetical protein GJAV_G00242440 [Gymnothorax javanicus]|nr:hypothetical protein GJAV_G00242440 [Gymnothorax javanicus]
MRLPKLAAVFILLACMVAYLTYMRKPAISKSPSHHTRTEVPDPGSERFHGTKTVTRNFQGNKTRSVAYADEPNKCKQGIQELLEVAQRTVPTALWKSSPLVLKATAGLRLLPGEKASELLDKVREVFKESPFLSRADGVSIMDGTEEGISAWITVNFLLGGLHGTDRFTTVGMLDLGGGSMQITFSPQDEKTIQTSPIDYITSFQMFNYTHTLYSHSYLGMGLMSRAARHLRGSGGPAVTQQWTHAKVEYTVRGQKEGEPIYQSCHLKVEKALYKKVKKAEEAKDITFYAFSYYYDRAVDIGAITEKTGGAIKVNDYIEAAKKVCNSMVDTPPDEPFLCLDLTYISVLLQELGFPKDKEFKLARKINDVETSWALGATFHYIESHSRD